METILFLVLTTLLAIPFCVLYYNKVVVPQNKRRTEVKKFRETEYEIKVVPASNLTKDDFIYTINNGKSEIIHAPIKKKVTGAAFVQMVIKDLERQHRLAKTRKEQEQIELALNELYNRIY